MKGVFKINFFMLINYEHTRTNIHTQENKTRASKSQVSCCCGGVTITLARILLLSIYMH